MFHTMYPSIFLSFFILFTHVPSKEKEAKHAFFFVLFISFFERKKRLFSFSLRLLFVCCLHDAVFFLSPRAFFLFFVPQNEKERNSHVLNSGMMESLFVCSIPRAERFGFFFSSPQLPCSLDRLNRMSQVKEYTFDYAYDETATQDEVYGDLGRVLSFFYSLFLAFFFFPSRASRTTSLAPGSLCWTMRCKATMVPSLHTDRPVPERRMP